MLFYFLLSMAAGVIGVAMHGQVIGALVGLALFLPSLALQVRRLHDTDRSGWWVLIGLVPLVGVILLIVWWCQDGTPGDNRFGVDTKRGASGSAVFDAAARNTRVV